MKEKIETRLQQLRTEYQKGRDRLAALEQEVAGVNSSMLRISGAIQILEELLEQDASPTAKNGRQRQAVDAEATL